MPGLQIYAPRERALVGAADALLRPLSWVGRHRADPGLRVARVLLLRLERIGDLLMTLDAIALARRTWPDATIDLAVGSWNLPLAKLIPGLGTIHTVDVPWLARERAGDPWTTLIKDARAWKRAWEPAGGRYQSPPRRTSPLGLVETSKTAPCEEHPR